MRLFLANCFYVFVNVIIADDIVLVSLLYKGILQSVMCRLKFSKFDFMAENFMSCWPLKKTFNAGVLRILKKIYMKLLFYVNKHIRFSALIQ